MVRFEDGIAETSLPGGGLVETEVVVVGSGPAGDAWVPAAEAVADDPQDALLRALRAILHRPV